MNTLAALLAAGSFLPQIQVREEAKDWKLLKTEHFEIYYPSDSLEPRAREFAGWFEEAHGRIKQVTGVTIRRTIHVFLYRSFHDLMQASLIGQFRAEEMSRALLGRGPVFPDRRREERPEFCRLPRQRALALAEPVHDRILIHCQSSDRWNLWFLRHELAHHAEFEALYPWRFPSHLIALKDPLVPAWWWEGYADFAAGIFESHKDEYVRDLSLERLYTLSEMFAFDSLNFHDFIAPYYEGSYFFRFLDEKYGANTSRRLLHGYASTLPYPMVRVVGRSVGKPVSKIEFDFKAHLQQRFGSMMAGRADAETFAKRVTDTRAYYRRDTWGGRYSPDGTKIAFVSDRDTVPEVYVASLSDPSDWDGLTGIRRGIDIEGFHSAPSWSPDGKRLVIAAWWKNHDYLLFFDLENGTESVRLDFDEIHDPCFSPDGSSVAFAALKDGYSDLYVYGRSGVQRLTSDRDGDAMPAWSPDGKTIVYVCEIGGRPQLHLLDVEKKERRKLGETYAVAEHPRWMPDGKSVVVSADVDGIFDLFRVDLEGNAKRLTKAKIGAHRPDVSPDGKKLLFTYVKNRGMDLYQMDLQEETEPGFAQEKRKAEYEQFPPPKPTGTPAEKKRRVGVEWLMGPVTSFSFLTPGLEARIADLDGENSINLQSFVTSGESWGAALTTVHTRWQPTFLETAFGGRFGDVQELGAGAVGFLPVLPTFGVVGGWMVRERHDVENRPFDEFLDSGPVLGAIWTNLSSYQPRDPSWGLAVGGILAYYDDDLGGDRDMHESFAFLEIAHDLAQDWILWGRVVYAGLDGDAFLEDEELELKNALRGADKDKEGTDLGVVSLELRFPIWRDLSFMPFEWLRSGESLHLKDLRGFVFLQGGYAADHFDSFTHGEGTAASLGAGVRLDLFFMLWPILNVRVPLRLEFWGAYVLQDEEKSRGEFGVGVGF